MREPRARESREEGETRRRTNADAMREARARESREEGETRWRANADAMREARARRIADRGWSHICPLAFRKYCCSCPNAHTKVAEASEVSEATCIHITYIGIHITYIGIHITCIGIHITYIGVHITYIGIHITYIGIHITYMHGFCQIIYSFTSMNLSPLPPSRPFLSSSSVNPNPIQAGQSMPLSNANREWDIPLPQCLLR